MRFVLLLMYRTSEKASQFSTSTIQIEKPAENFMSQPLKKNIDEMHQTKSSTSQPFRKPLLQKPAKTKIGKTNNISKTS